jgi:hypothetical protein
MPPMNAAMNRTDRHTPLPDERSVKLDSPLLLLYGFVVGCLGGGEYDASLS